MLLNAATQSSVTSLIQSSRVVGVVQVALDGERLPTLYDWLVVMAAG